MDLRKLPPPDAHGHYWFGQPGACVPAIIATQGGYFVSLGEAGLVWEDSRLVVFSGPAAALKELRRRLGVIAVRGDSS